MSTHSALTPSINKQQCVAALLPQALASLTLSLYASVSHTRPLNLHAPCAGLHLICKLLQQL